MRNQSAFFIQKFQKRRKNHGRNQKEKSEDEKDKGSEEKSEEKASDDKQADENSEGADEKPKSEPKSEEKLNEEIERLLEVSNIYTDEEDLDEKITHLLWQMGVPENLKGYGYLKSAVCLAMDDEEMLRCITKVLYSKEAKCYETTEIRVERAIRNAINVTFSKGNLSDILQLLGKDFTCKKLKPTNGELIKFLTQTAKYNCVETNNKE